MKTNITAALLATLLLATHASAVEPAKTAETKNPLPPALAENPANGQVLKVPSAKAVPMGAPQAPGANTPVAMPPLPPATLTPEQTKSQAFETLIDQELPMTPDQIRALRKLLDEQQRAKSELPYTPPKPVVSTIVSKGDPGESPPVVRLAKNFVSTLVFSDVTGAPWPVASFGTGNDDMFQVLNPDPVNARNVLTISTGVSYAYGNLQVILAGRPTPIMITLVSDQKLIDYLANVNVQARGPNAQAPILPSQATNFKANPVMLNIVDGLPPAKSLPLKSSDPRVQGWKIGNRYYLRTKMVMHSPAWTDHQVSPDGMHAYEIVPIPVIVASDNGNQQQVTITEN